MTRLLLATAFSLVACRPAVPREDGAAPAATATLAATGEVATVGEVERRVLEARLLGSPIGTLAIERAALANGGERWIVRNTMTLQLDDPGETAKTIESEEVTEYDASGEFVRSRDVTREQDVEETSEIVREGDALHVVKNGPSHRDDERFVLPDDARSEISVFRELVREARAGASLPLARTYSTFDEERMAFRKTTFTLEQPTHVDVAGEAIAGWAVLSEEDDGERTKAVFDERGMPLGFEMGVFAAVPVGSAPATAQTRLSSMLAVTGTFDERAATVHATIVVAEDEAELPALFADNEYQKVLRTGGTYTLELQSTGCDARCDGLRLPLDVPRDVAKFSSPTALSQSDATSIVERARAITNGRKDARVVAEAIVAWAFETLEKRDGTRGAATAVEALAQNGGDCTEHAALTVALLRAAGLPARNAAGIVLLPGRTGAEAGYHAWVEVWLGRWVAMDPALGRLSPGPHYIRIGHDEPGMNDGSTAISRLLGRTTIALAPNGP